MSQLKLVLTLLKGKYQYLLLIVFPLCFLSTGLHFTYVYRYISEIDPDYFYIVSFLKVIHFHAPHHLDHPGLSYDYFGAAIIKLYNFFNNKNDLEAVVKDPTFYLHIVRVVTLYISALLYFALGFLSYYYSRKIGLAFVLQLAPFLSRWPMWKALGVNVEAFFLILIPLLNIFLVLVYYKKELLQKRNFVILFALPFALLTLNKVTAILFLLIPMFLLTRWRERFYFFTAFTFFSFLLFIPAIPTIEARFQWWRDIMLHSGIHGGGEPTIINFASYPIYLKKILAHDLYLYIFSFLTALCSLFLKKGSWLRPLTWSLFLTQLCALLLVAKHYNGYYMLPFLLLSGFLIYLFFEMLSELTKERKTLGSIAKLTALLFFLLLLDSGYWNARGAIAGEKRMVAEYSSLTNKLHHQYPLCAQIHTFRSLDKGYGMLSGSGLLNEINRGFDKDKIAQYIVEYYTEYYAKEKHYYYDISQINNIESKYSCIIYVNSIGMSKIDTIHEEEFFQAYFHK